VHKAPEVLQANKNLMRNLANTINQGLCYRASMIMHGLSRSLLIKTTFIASVQIKSKQLQ